MIPPCILTIAGSDSGGGAGIQADLKTIMALGAFGTSVITAITSQNGIGVTGIYTPPPDFVELQLKTIYDGFDIKAAKTGMLFTSSIIESVTAILKEKKTLLVVDPVCKSQTGNKLLQEDAINTLCSQLIPLAALVTPNKPEAELLTGIKIQSETDITIAGNYLIEMGAKSVLIKGGHFEGLTKEHTDWYIEQKNKLIPLSQPSVNTINTHGTGCTLSAAITSYLGFGLNMKRAIIQAQQYLNYCLTFSYTPGMGVGPPNHAAFLTYLK